MTGLRVDRMRRRITRQDRPRPSRNRAVILVTEQEAATMDRSDMVTLRRVALHWWDDPATMVSRVLVVHPAFAPVPEYAEPMQWSLVDGLHLMRTWDRALHDPVGTP